MSKPWPGPVTAHWGEPGDATSPWRLVLRCRWGEGKPLVVVGMNPSTASEAEPDPTCQRWLSMAQRWGYAALTVLNLYPLRATSPKDMERGVFAIEGHPPRQVGRYPFPGQGKVFTDYCATITAALGEGDFILACWGGVEGGDSLLRAYYGTGGELPRPLAYLHRTPKGCPIHPLARLRGVEPSKLRPRDWNTGELMRLPIDNEPAPGGFPAGE